MRKKALKKKKQHKNLCYRTRKIANGKTNANQNVQKYVHLLIIFTLIPGVLFVLALPWHVVGIFTTL